MSRFIWVVVGLLTLQEGASAQTEQFRFQSAKVPVGTIYHYEKSNIDGSHKSLISLYVPAQDRLESLKWQPGSSEATLVVAEMDWTRYSVRRLQSYSLTAGKTPTLKAVLEYRSGEDRVVARAIGKEWKVAIGQWPWHSYDFDFASLNFTLPHLREPTASFRFGIADVVYLPAGPEFAYKGAVECRYESEERRHETLCRKYRVDGAGLEQRGGFLWVDKTRQHIVDYEIELPDEPGFRNGKLRLLRSEPVSLETWQQFKAAPGKQPPPAKH